MIEKKNTDIKQRILKLTLADTVQGTQGQLQAGNNININFDRVQAFGVVSKSGKHEGQTLLIMNTQNEVIYVKESPKDIKEMLGEKE